MSVVRWSQGFSRVWPWPGARRKSARGMSVDRGPAHANADPTRIAGDAYPRLERYFITMRWFSLAPGLAWAVTLEDGGFRFWGMVGVLIGVGLYNFTLWRVLRFRPSWLAGGAVPAICDLLAVVALIVVAGGFESPFSFAAIALSVSLAMRFGFRLAFVGVALIVLLDVSYTLLVRDAVANWPSLLYRSGFLIIIVSFTAYLHRQEGAARRALARQLQDARRMVEATALLERATELEDVHQAVADAARLLVGSDICIFCPEPSVGSVVYLSPTGAVPPRQALEMLHQVMALRQSWVEESHEEGEPPLILAGIPLKSGTRLLGGVVVCHAASPLVEQELVILEALAERAVQACEKADLFRRVHTLAMSDPVTGLANHRALMERLEAEVQRSQRYQREMALLIIDLDGFRAINDRWGHAVGDEVLRRVGQKLRGRARRADLVARYGGDEFIVLMPEADLSRAMRAAERFQAVLVDLTPELGIGLTASIGVSQAPVHGTTREDLLHRADVAMYVAKYAGGNRVRSASEVEERHGLEAVFANLTKRLALPTTQWGPALASELERSLYDVSSVRANLGTDGRLGVDTARLTFETITALARAIDAKDDYTEYHSGNVAALAQGLARAVGWTDDQVEMIHMAGLLHDVGKIGIPDSILKKPARLTQAEFALMKEHPVMSARILMPVEQLRPIIPWVKHHHENIDGTGYPEGLRAGEIPEGARILLIADAYEAMTSDRVYRKALGHDEAMRRLIEAAGKQFDPELVRVFGETFADIMQGIDDPKRRVVPVHS